MRRHDRKGELLLLCCLFTAGLAERTRFCQPGEACWPTQVEIDTFEKSLSPRNPDCLNLPTFSSKDKPGTPIYNPWYPEASLFITPYRLLNLRNRISDSLAYFVVLAQNASDVETAVSFARAHRLDVAVFSTGHEFNDRNAGRTSDAALLIRTTCLRTAEFELDPANQFGAVDGFARLGAGLTWGRSNFGLVGVHQLAAERDRVVVSGHASEVGIVGWSLGGGHGQLVGTFGMGVDQVLEVELVAADGCTLVANAEGTTTISQEGKATHTADAELFWALRGGGAGPWGIVTALTIKLHRARNNCTKACYLQSTVIWEGDFNADDGQVMEDVMAGYLAWTGLASRYWSSYGIVAAGDGGKYYFLLDALYVGKEEDAGDYGSLQAALASMRPDKIVGAENQTFDRFLDKLLSQDPESVYTASRMEPMVSVLLNASSVASPETAKLFTRIWVPKCYKEGTPCISYYLFMHTVSTSEDDDFYTGSAVSPAFRQAKVHVSASSVISLTEELTLDQKIDFYRSFVGPQLYTLSEGSYYSESEYSLGKGEWQTRFWTRDIYARLLAVKRQVDPDFFFGCRHCVGDEEEPANL